MDKHRHGSWCCPGIKSLIHNLEFYVPMATGGKTKFGVHDSILDNTHRLKTAEKRRLILFMQISLQKK